MLEGSSLGHFFILSSQVMQMAERTERNERRGAFFAFVRLVERGGNMLPHPLYIYIAMTALLYVISWICARAGVSVTYDALDRSTGEIVPTTLRAVSLLSADSLRSALVDLVGSYRALTMIPEILVITMFIAVADRSGFFSAMLRRMVLGAPRSLTTFMFALVAVCSSVMGDACMVISPTLGAVLYKAMGRNPWIGIMVGFGATASAYSPNLFPTNYCVLLSTITNFVSEPLGISVSPLSNYYFLAVCGLLSAAGVTVVAERVIVPLVGDGDGLGSGAAGGMELSSDERRGLRAAAVSFALYVALILCLTVPEGALLRAPDGSLLPRSPLISALSPILCGTFLTLGVSFGVASRTIKASSEIPAMMTEGVRQLAGLLVIFLPVGFFVYAFSLSNLSGILAVSGERFLRGIGLTGLPLLVVFSVASGVTMLFMYGGSSRWAIFAPIFVPMFMGLEIHPAYIQLAYRLGDSWSANITPLNGALMITLGLLEQHRDPKINADPPGLGTLIGCQLPITLVEAAIMTALFCTYWWLDLPIAPGVTRSLI